MRQRVLIVLLLVSSLSLVCVLASGKPVRRGTSSLSEVRVSQYDEASAQRWVEGFYKRYFSSRTSSTAKQGLTEECYNEYYKAGNGILGDVYDYLWESLPSEGSPRYVSTKPLGDGKFEVEYRFEPVDGGEMSGFAIVTVVVSGGHYRISSVELETE